MEDELKDVREKIAELEAALEPLRARERKLEMALGGDPPAFFHKHELE